MKAIQENAIELFLLIGISLISIGFFMYSTIIGFIGTGLLFIGLSFIAFKGGD